jgi:dolichol-phosphate mannosyltransferase
MIYFVIPAYDEERGVRAVCEAVCAQMDALGRAFALAVVDDGSADGTAAAVNALSQTRHEITLLRHERNLGVPRAFRTGLEWATAASGDTDIIFVLEADRTNDPALIPDMLAAMGRGAGVVIASRMIPGGAYVGFPPVRRFCSSAGNRLLRRRHRVPGVTDYTMFYRAYRAAPLRAMIQNNDDSIFQGRGFAVNAHILLRLHRAGVVCAEVPHRYRYNLKQSRSKMSLVYNIINYSRVLLPPR